MTALTNHLIPNSKNLSVIQDEPPVPHINSQYRKYKKKPERHIEWKNRHLRLNPSFYQREVIVKTAAKAFTVLGTLSFVAASYAAIAFRWLATPALAITVAALALSTTILSIAGLICRRKKEFFEDPAFRIKLGQNAANDIQTHAMAYPSILQKYQGLMEKYQILTKADINGLIQYDVIHLDYEAFLAKHGMQVFSLLDDKNLKLMKFRLFDDLRILNNGLFLSCKEWAAYQQKFEQLHVSKEDLNNQLLVDISGHNYEKVFAHHGEAILEHIDNTNFNFLRDKFIWFVQTKYERGVIDFLKTHAKICQKLQIDTDSQITMILTSQSNRLLFKEISYWNFKENNGDYIYLDTTRKENFEVIFKEMLRNEANLGFLEVKKLWAEDQKYFRLSDEEIQAIVIPRQLEALPSMGYIKFKELNGEEVVKANKDKLKYFFLDSFSAADYSNAEDAEKALASDLQLIGISSEEFKATFPKLNLKAFSENKLSFAELKKRNGDNWIRQNRDLVVKTYLANLEKVPSIGLKAIMQQHKPDFKFLDIREADIIKIVIPKELELLKNGTFQEFFERNDKNGAVAAKNIKGFADLFEEKFLESSYGLMTNLSFYLGISESKVKERVEKDLHSMRYIDFTNKHGYGPFRAKVLSPESMDFARKLFIDVAAKAPPKDIPAMLEWQDLVVLGSSPGVLLFNRWKDKPFKEIFADREEKQLFENQIKACVFEAKNFSTKAFDEIKKGLESQESAEETLALYQQALSLSILDASHKQELEPLISQLKS